MENTHLKRRRHPILSGDLGIDILPGSNRFTLARLQELVQEGTLSDLPKGAFVCECVGEILTNAELFERNSQPSSENHSYPVLLNADWGAEGVLKDEEALCLDATHFGNVARFINHRCFDSNMVEIPVEVETPDHHYYHVWNLNLSTFTNTFHADSRVADVMGGITSVPGFREDGEILVVTKDDELVSYDPNCNRTKKLGIRGVLESVYAGAYAESLVLLDGLKGRLASQVKSYKKSVPATKKWPEADRSQMEKHVAAQYIFADGSIPFTANSGIDYGHVDEDTASDLLLMADMAREFLP